MDIVRKRQKIKIIPINNIVFGRSTAEKKYFEFVAPNHVRYLFSAIQLLNSFVVAWPNQTIHGQILYVCILNR